MTPFKRLLQNRNAIFVLALAAGLAFPAVTPLTRHLVLPLLALVMTLSTMEIGNELFRKPRAFLLPAFIGIIMNYILLGNIIIGLATFMVRDETIWTGFILLAAVPPAVAVIPFSGLLKGNGPLSLFGTVGAYLGALAIMPLIAVGLLLSASFQPLQLFRIILELIVLPLCVSRILIRDGLRERIAPYRGTVTNWGFFVVLYTLVGLNRNILFDQPSTLLPVFAISIATMFVLGFLIDWTASLFHLASETRTSLVLLGTLKNYGMAGGIALTMFSQEAALPAAVATMVMIPFIIWLDFRKHWSEERREP